MSALGISAASSVEGFLFGVFFFFLFSFPSPFPRDFFLNIDFSWIHVTRTIWECPCRT